MINNFLKAKYIWEAGNPSLALEGLNDILKSSNSQPSFLLQSNFIEFYSSLSFENAVSNIFLDKDSLLVPFKTAFQKLWNMFPVQFLMRIVEQKTFTQGAFMSIANIVSDSANQGLISNNINDYDLSGKVVLREEDYPNLLSMLDSSKLGIDIEEASNRKAWQLFFLSRPTLVVNLFCYAVFHQERTIAKELVVSRLEKISECHNHFIEMFKHSLHSLLDQSTAQKKITELYGIGMKVNKARDLSVCLDDFLRAIDNRSFDQFFELYYE